MTFARLASAALSRRTLLNKTLFTLSAAALFLSRWGWDLASAKVGCEPQYFPEFAEEIKTIAQAANPTGLYTWINSVRDIRRVSEHPLNAKTMIEALLISYARNI